MSDRELVLDAVGEMPETASLREIVDELQMMAVLQERLKKNPRGQGVAAEDLLQRVVSWTSR